MASSSYQFLKTVSYTPSIVIAVLGVNSLKIPCNKNRFSEFVTNKFALELITIAM